MIITIEYTKKNFHFTSKNKKHCHIFENNSKRSTQKKLKKLLHAKSIKSISPQNFG